ncbi:Hypothetical protein PHPALM_14387 [Phytophthora palmivora]|uniref:Ubiquitin-like protease family profile domain-containing protein n=1 Tax=Phytophthora palmivora TaxID=4796 RepID=A0A2P4XUT3_9STRA|nr:Hypothetical protein PHPALM_14387 [Phytophthora palmivora]
MNSALWQFTISSEKLKAGVVSACGTTIFQEIELASSGCRNLATKKKALRKAINNFDWGAYRFVLLPIGGLNHWSLAIIENVMLPEETKVYHIDSLKDCGIYLLHYMDKMATGIVGLQSKSILGQVETWCQSGFNSPKAEHLRTLLQ